MTPDDLVVSLLSPAQAREADDAAALRQRSAAAAARVTLQGLPCFDGGSGGSCPPSSGPRASGRVLLRRSDEVVAEEGDHRKTSSQGDQLASADWIFAIACGRSPLNPGSSRRAGVGSSAWTRLRCRTSCVKTSAGRGALQRSAALGVVEEILIHRDIELALARGDRYLL